MTKGIYKANAFNKKVGRAGKPYGSCVLKCVAVSKKKTIIRKRKKPVKQPATPPKPPPQKKKSTPQKKERKRWWEYKLEFWRDKDAHDRMTDKGWKLIHNDGFKLYYRKYGTPSEIRDDTEGHHNQPKLVVSRYAGR